MASAKTAASKTSGETLREFRNTDKTLYARNNTAFKITCHDKVGQSEVHFELEPKGEDDSIKIMPKECLAVAGFQRLWMKKAITISDDEAMEDEILLLMGGQVEKVKAAQEDLLANVEENSANKDLIERTCLLTGTKVFQTKKDMDAGIPPLAEHVQDKAYLFPGEQRADDQGNTYWHFPKVSIGMGG